MSKLMTVSEAGKLGGDKLLKTKPKDYFINLSKLGVEARRAKKALKEASKDAQTTL